MLRKEDTPGEGGKEKRTERKQKSALWPVWSEAGFGEVK